MNARSLFGPAAAGVLVVVLFTLDGPHLASADDDTSVEGCIQQRNPIAALVKTTDNSLVELDLRPVLGPDPTPYALRPDDCHKFHGVSLGQGQDRVYGQAGWVLRVFRIDNADSHEYDKSKEVTDNDTSKASQTGH